MVWIERLLYDTGMSSVFFTVHSNYKPHVYTHPVQYLLYSIFVIHRIKGYWIVHLKNNIHFNTPQSLVTELFVFGCAKRTWLAAVGTGTCVIDVGSTGLHQTLKPYRLSPQLILLWRERIWRPPLLTSLHLPYQFLSVCQTHNETETFWIDHAEWGRWWEVSGKWL